MQGVNALAEIASSLPDFIGGASRNDDGGQTSSQFFSGEPRRDTRNDATVWEFICSSHNEVASLRQAQDRLCPGARWPVRRLAMTILSKIKKAPRHDNEGLL
jgi:hypothetical protein